MQHTAADSGQLSSLFLRGCAKYSLMRRHLHFPGVLSNVPNRRKSDHSCLSVPPGLILSRVVLPPAGRVWDRDLDRG